MIALARPHSQARDTGEAFVQAFIVCLVVISLPIKNAAYLAAPIYVAISALQGRFRFLRRLLLIATGLLLISSASMMWDAMSGTEVNVSGLLLSFLTFLPFLVLFAERPDKPLSEKHFSKLVHVACWFLIIQSAIGVAQFVVSGNPDAVCGSFGLMDFAKGTITITQVFFTFTMFGMILLLMVARQTPLTLTAMLLGLVTCALAQSGHQTIFFVASMAALGFSRVSRPSTILATGLVAGLIFAATMIVYPQTIELTRDWYRKVVNDARSPKRMAVEGGVEIMSDFKNMAFGTGLGQYSSRAALISSNEYLTVTLPSPMVGMSDYYRDHIRPATRVFEEVGEGSAISKPYFSWLGFLVELGLIQFFVLLALIAASFVDNWRLMRHELRSVARVGFVANVGIMFFVLCCAIENYAEFPQAVFIPFLLYVAVRSKAKFDLSRAPVGQAGRRGKPIQSLQPALA